MATQIVQASASATRPTAPLPPAAAEALARLQSAFAGPSVPDIAARHAAASRTCQQLSHSSDWMAPAEFDRLANVQDELAMYHSQIEQADHLARLTAARETADRIVAQVGDWDGGESPRLLVTVIDPETRERLGTAFVTVRPEPATRPLRLVREAS